MSRLQESFTGGQLECPDYKKASQEVSWSVQITRKPHRRSAGLSRLQGSPNTATTSKTLLVKQIIRGWSGKFPGAVIKKASQEGGGDTSSCSIPYPKAACPEFHVR